MGTDYRCQREGVFAQMPQEENSREDFLREFIFLRNFFQEYKFLAEFFSGIKYSYLYIFQEDQEDSTIS